MNKLNFIVLGLIGVLIGATIFVVYYSDSSEVPTVKDEPLAIDTNATSESVSFLTNNMNNFSFELYKELIDTNEENIFFSPYSIFVALSMTYEGARGDTAEEMENVLGFPRNNDTMLCSFGRLYNLYNQKKEYTLNTANALWTQEGYLFLDNYLNFIENYYMGKATDVDFNNPSDAADIINNWVEKNTGNKIKDLVDSNELAGIRLILTNAIYFKGDWTHKFDTENTEDKDFELSSGVNISVPMMNFYDDDVRFYYNETKDLQILELPYKGEEVSMLILLPKENNISLVEQRLNYENYTIWNESLSESYVKIFLPKFKLETEYKLNDPLIDMGMNKSFTPAADFSGMTGYKDLYIDKVKHKAFVEVDEEGTEAAAATSVHMKEMAAEPPDYVVFNADHPFIFIIRHKQTGNILFMGRLSDPEL